jgi:hypothetical protein
MKAQEPELNAIYPAKRCHYVLRLGDELPSAACADEAEVRKAWRGSGGLRGLEDKAQKPVSLEVGGNRIVRRLEPLARMDRGREKERPHGFSDVSGRPNSLSRRCRKPFARSMRNICLFAITPR